MELATLCTLRITRFYMIVKYETTKIDFNGGLSMKKRLLGALLSAALSITMATPAFAEIIWTPDKLPAGYTTNEWENKDFSFYSGTAIKRDTYTYYIKDLHGNIMKNAIFAGGTKTDENGVIIDAIGHVCTYGSELGLIEYANTRPHEQPKWYQDTLKPLNENGLSNYWYGTSAGTGATSMWRWLMVAPDGTQDGLKYAYCFNEYGYLYTNTITPDGYQVNELGQLMIEGKVMTREPNDITTWHGFVSFSIGYLVYDLETSEQHKYDTPNPYF